MDTGTTTAIGIIGITPPNYRRIKAMFGSALIAHYPVWDLTGTTATDISGNAYHATYTGGTLAAATFPLGKPCANFTTPVGGINIGASAGFRSAFNGNEGFVAFNCQMPDWYSAVQDEYVRVDVDAANSITVYRPANAANIWLTRVAAGGASTHTYVATYPSTWLNIICSWSLSAGYQYLYVNGERNQYAAAETAITHTWAGTLGSTTTRAFARTTTTQSVKGNASDLLFGNRAITDAEARRLSKLMFPQQRTMSWIGDAFQGVSNTLKNPVLVTNEYTGGNWRRVNHFVALGTILDNMADLVAAAANDDADIIITDLGRFDLGDGDMGVIQGIVEAGLEALQVSNPRADIFYRGLLPSWTDTTGTTPITTYYPTIAAIKAACTATGIVYWDAYDPNEWITAAQTTEGYSPTVTPTATSGHRSIATEILARLP